MSASTNPLRFGINLTGPARPYTELLATDQLAEELGFDTVAMTDRPPENNYEARTLASAIGALTHRIRLTPNPLNVPLRNAALLARMASSLDAIAGADQVILTRAGSGPTRRSATRGACTPCKTRRSSPARLLVRCRFTSVHLVRACCGIRVRSPTGG